jgi:ABC-2 type transport system ATP-binding protein
MPPAAGARSSARRSPENHRFPKYLTGRQVLHFFGAMAKVDRRTAKRRAEELLATVGMTADADRLISTYSKGMAQRIGLAQAMMNDPDLILLDEPTDGVDPVGRRDIREVLHGLRDRGKTVFINSHQLGELDAMCSRVAILVGGQVKLQGTVNELGVARQRYEIEIASTSREVDDALLRQAVPMQWHGSPLAQNGSPWFEIASPVLRIGTTDAACIQAVIDSLRNAGCVIRRVQAIRPSLEELFFDTVGPAALPATSDTSMNESSAALTGGRR